MSKYKKLFTNTIWFGISNASSKAVLFLLLPLYTIYLNEKEFGVYELLNTAIFFLIPLFTLQISHSLLRFGLDTKEDKKEIISSSIVFTVGGLIVSLMFYPLVLLYEPMESYANYFYILLLLRILYTTLQSILKTVDKVKLLAAAGIVESISILGLSFLLLVKYELGLMGYFITLIVSLALACLTTILIGKPFAYVKFSKFSFKKTLEMLKFSLPLIPNSMNNWFMNLSNRYFIEYFLNIASTGLFGIASRIPGVFQVFYATFYNAWIISAFENYNSADRKYYFSTIYELLFLALALFASTLIFIIKPIMSVLVSDRFFEAAQYMPFLLIGLIFYGLTSFLGVLYLGEKKTKGVLATSIIGSTLSVLFNILLIPLWGINGASFSFFLSFFVVWTIRVSQTDKFFPLSLPLIQIFASTVIVLIQIWMFYTINEYFYAYQFICLLVLLLVNTKSIRKTITQSKNILEFLSTKKQKSSNTNSI